MGPLADCTSLAMITVDALNSVYSSKAGVLFNRSQAELIQYPAAKAGSYTIPNSVTSIDLRAFAYWYGLTSLTIDVTTIGSHFSGMKSLTEIIIGDHVATIGDRAFSVLHEP